MTEESRAAAYRLERLAGRAAIAAREAQLQGNPAAVRQSTERWRPVTDPQPSDIPFIDDEPPRRRKGR